jgi:tetratricopeptide (TPR) repeat protein
MFGAKANATETSKIATSFTVSSDTVLTINRDETFEKLVTIRIKVLGEVAVSVVGQQSLAYVQDTQTLDILEAFTEKADGRKIQVEPTNILTRDGATGMALILMRDLKVRTILFPDVAVGDTLSFTYRQSVKSHAFSGHFGDVFLYPREFPFGETKLRIEFPRSVPVKVALLGEGLEHEIVESGDTTSHLVSYRPGRRTIGEPGQTSPLDRDPRIIVSTFRDFNDLGRSWLDVAGTRTAVTPEIAALAEEITRGIDDRRAQAEAIDRWVKRNIRYVALYLNTAAGWVPHETSEILKNRFGDCKDHATLMGALLAAKGIASEAVIINATDVYTMPSVAAPGYHNHMIIYLPEFALYDDPTVGHAAFGVLAEGDYDKPVVRMGAAGVHIDRTPPMRDQDHVTINRTRITVATDHTISGETREVNTGVWATGLRGTVGVIQHNGAEKAAENQLRANGTPGKGRFELGGPLSLSDPFELKGEFTLDAKLNTAWGAESPIPVGLATRVRAGRYLLGQRHEGRKRPFICYAGRQIEEIELTFAEGVPLPLAPKGRKIEQRAFTFTSDYRLEDRTLKVRREFVSRVAGQVCAPEIESQIANALKGVQADLDTKIRMPARRLDAIAEAKPETAGKAEPRLEAATLAKAEPRIEAAAERKPALPAETRLSQLLAAQSPNRSWCLGGNEASADLRIHGCTAIILSGQETPKSLAVAFANRGYAYRMKGDYARAFADFDQAIRIAPDHAAAFNGRGLTWYSLRDYDRAVAEFNEAMRLAPTFAKALVNRGNAYRDKGAADLAMRDFDGAVRLDPKLAWAYLSRGRAHRAAGDYVRAAADFDEAIRLQRGNAVAWAERCHTQSLAGKVLKALEACNESLKLRPNDSATLTRRPVREATAAGN